MIGSTGIGNGGHVSSGALEGKVAIVTGAGRGIGRAEALLLAKEGASVVVNDVGGEWDGTGADTRPAQQVVEEIRTGGGQATPNYDNVADFDAAARIVGQAIEEFGKIDILVNNAGILRDRMIFNMEIEDFDSVISVHLRGHFCMTRHVAAYWREQSKQEMRIAGRVINTSSASGVFGNPGQANYAAAKAGIAALTQVCSMELSRYGVTVNALCPTARTRLTQLGTDMGVMAEDGGEGWHPLDPENVAPLVAYLASDAAAHITGQVFGVFGGTVQLYEGWRLGPTVRRATPGPFTLEELTFQMQNILEARSGTFESRMREVTREVMRAVKGNTPERKEQLSVD